MCSVMDQASEKSVSSGTSKNEKIVSHTFNPQTTKRRKIIPPKTGHQHKNDDHHSLVHTGIPETCYGNIENTYNDIAKFSDLDRQIYYELKSEDFGNNSKFRPKWNRTLNDVYVARKYQGFLPEERLKNGPLLESLAKRMAPLAHIKTRKVCLPRFLQNHRSTSCKPKHFQGNINYLNFFNREAYAFLHFKRTPDDPAPSFKYSLMATDGSMIYRRRLRSETEHGIQRTMWKPGEKERFFQLLSRYSIHRIDAICEQLPSKSKSEILTYYRALSKQLKRMKNSKTSYQRLIPMSEMPIAYEMSYEYTQFEESQSRFLLNVVPPEDFMRTPFSSRKLDKYHLWDHNEDLINWEGLSSSFGIRIVNPNTRKGFEESEDDQLEIRINPFIRKIPTLTKIMLKDLTVNFLYSLLLGVVEKKIAAQTVQKLSYNNRVLMPVTTKDILESFHQLTNRESTVLEFWENLISEIGGEIPKRDLKFRDPCPIYNRQDEECEKNDTNSNIKSKPDFKKISADFDDALQNTLSFDDLQYAVNDDIRERADKVKSEIQDSDDDLNVSFEWNDNVSAKSEVASDSDESMLDVGAVKVRRSKKRKREEDEFFDEKDRSFVSDDPKTDKELEMSEKLFLMETSLLERMDHEVSVKYERLCLGYMMSHPRFVDKNDDELTKFYILQKYYPKELPFYYIDDLPEMKILQLQAADKKKADDCEQALNAYVKREAALNDCMTKIKSYEQDLRPYSNLNPEEKSKTREKLEHERNVKYSLESTSDLYNWINGPIPSDSKTGALNIPLEYDGEFVHFAHYNENDPYAMCVFQDVTDDMLYLHNYQFSSYDK